MAVGNCYPGFRYSFLTAALLAAFTGFYANTSNAYETFPIIADDGTHYFNINVLTPGEYHSFAQEEYGLPLTDRFVNSSEIEALKMAAEYFWQLLKNDYKSPEPINILLLPYSTQDGNAAADSPLDSDYPMTQLGSAWKGLNTPESNEAVYIILDRPYQGEWHTETFPVLPNQGLQQHLTVTLMHELFHGFGLGVTFSQDESGNIGLFADNPSLYAQHLHDLNGRSFADLFAQSQDGFVPIHFVDPKEPSSTPLPDHFNIYDVDRDSGMYFSGDHVKEVLDGALIAWPEDLFGYGTVDEARKPVAGLPINGMEPVGLDPDGNLVYVLEGSHIELQNSLMSHQFYRNWGVLMEAEIALLQDIGYNIDRKRFFGYSIYKSGTKDSPLYFENTHGYWARNEEGTDWIKGQASAQSWGIGLHIYGSYNHVIQKASLLADGDWGVGARIEGVGNQLTVESGTLIEANGRGGRGLLFSWGKEHNAVIEEGATVRAIGSKGIAVSFDFGSNILGDYQGYFGSYTAMYDEQTTLPTVLNGPLVENFTVAGTLEGSLASIYISPNAYVRNVTVLPGAQIKGDIISLWNPYETIYGPGRHIDEREAHLYTTTLTFGSETQTISTSDSDNKVNFEGNILGRDSIHLVVSDASLAMNGHADVIDVSVSQSGELEGGSYTLNGTDSKFLNEGHLISTALNPVVIDGNYTQTETASLTLSVSGGRYIPLSVSGTAVLPDTLRVIGTPEGGWHPSGLIKVDEKSSIVAGVENTASTVDFSWKDPVDMAASPVLKIEKTSDGLLVTRKENPYSQFMPSELKDIGVIWDQSAENLTESSSQKLFAALDWSSPETIAKAADALSGNGISDGLAASMRLERIAQNYLTPDLTSYTLPGHYLWVSPLGGSAKAGFNGSMRMRLTGIAAGSVTANEDFASGYSVMTLDAGGDGTNISDYEAKGIWLSAFIHDRNFWNSGIFADLSARLGYIDSEEKRQLTFAGLADETKADIDHWSFGLTASVGKKFTPGDSTTFEPYAGLSGFIQYVPSYEENSNSAGALQTSSAMYRSLETNLGLRLDGQSQANAVTAHWQIYAQYARELLTRAGQTRLSFAASDLRGHFERDIDWQSKNRIETGFKLGLTDKNGFSLSAEINYERDSSDSESLLGAFKAQWRF